jgi:hypothetical protein
MAEIRLEREPKRGLGWLWALLLVLLIAAVAWYLWSHGYVGSGGTARSDTAAPRSDTTRTGLNGGRHLFDSLRATTPLLVSRAA